jgi:hypothetical protein
MTLHKRIGGCDIIKKPKNSKEKTFFTSLGGVKYIKKNPKCGKSRSRRLKKSKRRGF